MSDTAVEIAPFFANARAGHVLGCDPDLAADRMQTDESLRFNCID